MGASKRKKNSYLEEGPGAFFLHKVDEAGPTYNYYGFMHVSGNSYLMRETIATSLVDYVDGGHRLDDWDNRATPTYGSYSDIFDVNQTEA